MAERAAEPVPGGVAAPAHDRSVAARRGHDDLGARLPGTPAAEREPVDRAVPWPAVGVSGWGWFFVFLGLVFDLGSYGGGAYSRRR
jgi:hypothetical protein